MAEVLRTYWGGDGRAWRGGSERRPGHSFDVGAAVAGPKFSSIVSRRTAVASLWTSRYATAAHRGKRRKRHATLDHKCPSNPGRMVVGPYKPTAHSAPTHCTTGSPMLSPAAESWRGTKAPNWSSRTRPVVLLVRTVAATIRAGSRGERVAPRFRGHGSDKEAARVSALRDAVLEVVRVEFELRGALAVRCKECGASGPPSHTADPQHAVSAWNQRAGRLTVVK